MFSTFKQKLLLGVYIFLILSIPIGTYLVSQSQTIKSKASEANRKAEKDNPSPTSAPKSPLEELLAVAEANVSNIFPKSSPSPESSSPTIATSFGPTLSLKINIEGRPEDDQTTKLFIGIVEGSISTNPKFLLSFSVEVPESGEYSNLSLAGLTPGSKYTALLKGTAQIATSSAFVMSPAVTNLNNGNPLSLISGDLNDDNNINSADFSIAQKSLNTTASSVNWNSNADFNKDGIINIFDLSLITKNLGKVGSSGIWTSPLPKAGSASGAVATDSTQPSIGSTGGHWLWIP